MIIPFGETALLVELSDSTAARALAASIEATPVDGIVEVVPGLRSVLVEIERSADADTVRGGIEARLSSTTAAARAARRRRIPVVYGGDRGPLPRRQVFHQQCGGTRLRAILPKPITSPCTTSDSTVQNC